MNPLDYSWMIGQYIKVSFHQPDRWLFEFGDSMGISVECPWRLLEHGRIVVSDADDQQQYGLPAPINAVDRLNSLLAGAMVRGVELRDGTADIFVDFDGGFRLEIIPFSSGYESWQISAPNGKTIIAQGGGNLVVCC